MSRNLINCYLINITFPPNFSIFSFAEFEIKFVSISNFSFISPDPSSFNLLYFLFTSWDFCKVDRFNLEKEKETKKELEFTEKIDELNQETDILLEEIDKWQM